MACTTKQLSKGFVKYLNELPPNYKLTNPVVRVSECTR